MAQNDPFTPLDNATSSLSASNSTSRVQFFTDAMRSSQTGKWQVRIRNQANVDVFVRFGGSSVVAVVPTGSAATPSATGDIPIAAGATEVLGFDSSTEFVAGITSSGSGTILFTPGFGI